MSIRNPLIDKHGNPKLCDCGKVATRIYKGHYVECDDCYDIEQATRYNGETAKPRQFTEPFLYLRDFQHTLLLWERAHGLTL